MLISTPAWAFLKMSFSSNKPRNRNHVETQSLQVQGRTPRQLPLPPLNMQMPPSLPSWILFLRRVGLLSVLIHTPAMALSKISLSSIKPKPGTHAEVVMGGVRRTVGEGALRAGLDLLTRVIHQDSSVLASPDLVAPDLGIAASSVSENIQN